MPHPTSTTGLTPDTAAIADSAPGLPLRRRAFALIGGLILVNLLLWGLTGVAAGMRQGSLLLSAALLAYGFGLRHAVDADHIAAIDNVTRKLMRDGGRPLTVGLFFSLGHSTVVVALCMGLAFAAGYVERALPAWHAVGEWAGATVSGLFLLLIGAVNVVALVDLLQRYRRNTGHSGSPAGADGDETDGAPPGGIIGRLLGPVLRLIRHPAQMYFVGLLFGLGFDTATEIGVLALSARSGQAGLPWGVILLLPLLFTAAMSLADTLDGILMLGVYGWAAVEPRRKLGYNVAVTLLSVAVAFVIGGYELLTLLQRRLDWHGGFWDALERLPFDNLGIITVALFAVGWAAWTMTDPLRRRGAIRKPPPSQPSG